MNVVLRSRMRLGVGIAALALAAVLAGCAGGAGGGMYYGFYMTALYSWRQLGYVQAQGPVPVSVRGSPFPDAPPDVFARTVAASMTGANFGPPLTFTADPPGPREAWYRVVLVFGSVAVGGSDLCALKEMLIQPTGPRAHAEAAFCIEDRRISEIRGDMTQEATGPDDPAFIAFVRGLTANLFPPRDAAEEDRRRGGCRLGIC